MSVERLDGMEPAPLAVVGQGIDFSAEYNGHGVEVCVEYPDGDWSVPNRTGERCITIAREDWDAIIAHVAAQRGEAAELLREVADSGVAFDDPRLSWVEVQIDRDVWQRLVAAWGGDAA